VAQPASFDADVNLNVRNTRVGHLDIGPSSIGFALRDGVLNAMLGGMELYDGQGSGRLVVDATKAVPEFTGNFQFDGVQIRPLLSDATQFNLLSGRTKLDLQLSGAGSTNEEIKASLQGEGNIAISEGAIEGINLTELIGSIGAGEMPNLRQGAGAKTAFSDLGGNFTITNGIAETNNLQMVSPLLKVAAAGTVDLNKDSINILANPQIVDDEASARKKNALAGLSVPVRIEGPLQNPSIRPEVKGLFASPERAGETVRQLGDAIQKKFKGKPVGEALGRFLGNVEIKRRDGGGAPPAGRTPTSPGLTPESPADADPQVDDILR
jgi:AsmA protein